MTAAPSSPTYPSRDLAEQRAGDAQYYRGVLHRLIDVGAGLAEAIHREAALDGAPERPATASPDATVKLAGAFDRVARAVRGAIGLARKLSEPERPPRAPAKRPAEARDSALGRLAAAPAGAELSALTGAADWDEPDDEDLEGQSVESLVAAIQRDLSACAAHLASSAAPPAAALPAPGYPLFPRPVGAGPPRL